MKVRGNRISTVTTAFVLLLALAASSCKSSAGTTDSGGTAAPIGQGTAVANDEGKPVAGGKLAFAVDAESDGFNPAASNFALPAYLVGSSMLDSLAAVDRNRQVQPYLAESITSNADATVWTIKVRPGVTFHDGKPCDAEAVAANIRAQKTGIPSLTMKPIKDVDGVVVTGPLSLEVRMNQPWAAFEWLLTSQQGMIASKATLTDPDGARHPVGTGPFVFDQWTTGKNLTVKKNPHYWQPGKPYLDSIDYRILTDPQARSDALTAGDVDLIYTNEIGTIADFRNKPGYTEIVDTSGEADFVVLNAGEAPFDNINARKAIALATDQQRLIDVVGNGLLVPTGGVFYDGSPYFTKDDHYPKYDLDAAKAAVAQYTKETGKPLAFTYTALPDVVSQRTAQLLQEMWQAAGAQVTLDGIEQTKFISKLITGQIQATEISNFGLPDPDWNYIFWHSDYTKPIGDLSINFSHTVDPQLDAALDQGRTSTDPAVRQKAYQTVTQRLNDDYAYVWLHRSIGALIGTEKVGGLGYPEQSGFARTDFKPWIADLWVKS